MEPLNCHLYEVKGRVYRRNVPLEQIGRWNPNTNGRIFNGADDEEPLECIVASGGGPDYDADDVDASNEPQEDATDAQEESLKPELIVTDTPPGFEEENKDSIVKYDQKKKCWYTSIDFPASLMGKLFGLKGQKLRKIQASTQCKVKAPARGHEAPVEITSSASAECVERCRDQIELVLIEARKSQPYTHFLTFQVQDSAAIQRYKEFVEKVRDLSDIPDVCRNKALYIPPEKIHLTIAPLWLLTEEDQRRAKACLDSVVDEKIRPLLGGQALTAKVQSLGHFGDEEISAVRVLYGKVFSDKLQEVSDVIADAFEKIGLSGKRRTDQVKLHMTILNTRYAVEQGSAEQAAKVDATQIVKHFGDYDFGNIEFSRVHICKMHETDPNTKGHPIVHSKELVRS
ncbi:KH domain-containing protein [Aphelenchoides avenae]|nr:KH domain-containing protein [Aphelenchus avenae]